jgi:ATP-dependent Clp protease ATP-binding subunit ClpB
VLFDEIEKAHHDVFNILLQLFDDGRITDSKGRTVNCKNALFIMTSNLGSQQLLEKIEKQPNISKQEILNLLEPILRAHFRPEFLNRLDEILPFLPLKETDMEKIVILQLEQLSKRIAERHVTLKWTQEAVTQLAEKGYDPYFGARPLKRLVQHEIVNMLSNAILDGQILGDSVVTIDYNSSKEAFFFTMQEFVTSNV